MIKKFGIIPALAGTLFASDSAWAAKYTAWWLPDNVSTFGTQVDKTFYIILAITTVIFFLVEATLLTFLIKYRNREGQKAKFIHGHHTLEIVWTIIPAAILVWLAFYQRGSWAEIKQNFPAEKDAFVVETSGQQFEWHFNYAGPDQQFGTADDIETINQLHVPVEKPVLLKISSKDVIHSFFLPEFRLKQDAVPGLVIPAWFKPLKTGVFDVACAELCGLGHYRMRGFLNVYTQSDLDTKLSELAQETEEEDIWE
ncbi:MAG: cytochrome c oxidase subunit II [Candidatus Omnitrophica bacterium]|nr:cytochrome c oxidase subunit II [Candidatus Omnitrophota bacterium]